MIAARSFAVLTTACTHPTAAAPPTPTIVTPSASASAPVLASAPIPAPASSSAPATLPDDGRAGMQTTPSGLAYVDSVVGTGPLPTPGQTCVLHYTGWLWIDGHRGAQFDSSVDRGLPFEFAVGKGIVIKGWDEAVATMTVGTKRRMILPPSIAYGTRRLGGKVPANSTLYFEIELLAVK